MSKAHIDKEIVAAIALALNIACDESLHIKESNIITIRHFSSNWATKGQTFRMLPDKK